MCWVCILYTTALIDVLCTSLQKRIGRRRSRGSETLLWLMHRLPPLPTKRTEINSSIIVRSCGYSSTWADLRSRFTSKLEHNLQGKKKNVFWEVHTESGSTQKGLEFELDLTPSYYYVKITWNVCVCDKIVVKGGVHGLFTRRLAVQATSSTHLKGGPIYWLM